MCCIFDWSNEGQHCFIRNIYIFFYSFERSWSFCGMWDRRKVGRQDRLPHWPTTSSFEHRTLCYLRDPLSTSSATQPGLVNRKPGMGHRPQLCTLTDCNWLWLGLHWLKFSPLEAAQLEAAVLSGAHPLAANWLSLRPSLSLTVSNAAGICIYYFITPTDFRLDHMIFFHLFTQVHLWLTARSRVLKKQLSLKKFLLGFQDLFHS